MAVAATTATDAAARLMIAPKASRRDWAIALTTSSESAGHEAAQNRDLHHSTNDGAFTAVPTSEIRTDPSDIHASGMGLMIT